MTRPFLMTDFLSKGLDAAKPASPILDVGTTAFYWATDTLRLYGWTGTSWVQMNSGAVPASIVQNSSIAVANHSTGITLATPPVQGNLLVALISAQGTFPALGSGWTSLGTAAAVNDGWGIFWKLAGIGESATQFPAADTQPGTITVYEIANGSPGPILAATQYFGTTINEGPINTKLTNGGGLIVGVYVNRTTTGPASITGAGVVVDNTAIGVSRFAAAFHIAGAVNGPNGVTANYATAQGGVFMAISVG